MSAALFLETLGRASAQAAILVLLVLVVQGLLGRWLRPRWRCALWLVVAGRLLLPFSADTAFSLFNWLPAWPRATAQSVAAPVRPAEAPVPAPVQTAVRPEVMTVLPGLPTAPVAPPLAREIWPPNNPSESAPRPSTAPVMDLNALHSATRVPAEVTQPFPLAEILFTLWLAGALGLAIHIARHSLRLARAVAGLPRCKDADALAVLRQCQLELGLRQGPDLFESPAVGSPVLYGLARPRLILPAGFTRRFSTDELRCVFLHELAHLQRRDIQLNWLWAVLQVLHWFNPLVWLAVFRWRLDRELDCDARALEALGAERRQEYGRVILRLLESVTRPLAAPGLVGILEDKNQLRQRITMISRFRGRGGWGVLSFLLVATLGLVCLTDAQVRKEEPGREAKASETSRAPSPEPLVTLVGADPIPGLGPVAGPPKALIVTVVEAATGQPLPNAEIKDTRTYPASAGLRRPRRLTDAAGRFILYPLKPASGTAGRIGSFTVTVEHPRFAAREAVWGASSNDPDLYLPAEIKFALEPGVTIGGRVTDGKGKPLKGVQVLLEGTARIPYPHAPMDDGRSYREYAVLYVDDPSRPAALTDANGRWAFPHFPADLEYVQMTFVRPNQSRTSFAPLSDNLRTLPSPIARMRNWQGYPEVELSDLLQSQARFVLLPGFAIRGLVTDEAGRPVKGATVTEGFGQRGIGAKLTTDRRGRFECLDRAPREWVYTASAPGRGTVSQIVRVHASATEVKLVLPPAQPARLSIVDDAGKPVPDALARVDADRGNDGQRVEWSATADANGLVVWPEAPVKATPVFIGSARLGVERRINVVAGEARQVRLSRAFAKETKVSLRAVDAASGTPVIMTRVRARDYAWGYSGFRGLSEPKTAATIVTIERPGGQAGVYGGFDLQVEAEGYEPALLPRIEFIEGDQEVEARLTRGVKIPGQVLQPDGRPAAEARFWFARADFQGLTINMAYPHYGSHAPDLFADANGRFELPLLAGNITVIVLHPEGLRELPLADLKRGGSLKLAPWGRVEGRFAVDPDNPRPANNLFISHAFDPRAPRRHLSMHGSVTPDATGRFIITNIPPGEYAISPQHVPRAGTPVRVAPAPAPDEYVSRPRQERVSARRVLLASHPVSVSVPPGGNVVISPDSAGRKVTGRAEASSNLAEVDWTNENHLLVLKQPPLAKPRYEDFVTQAGWEQARDEYGRDPERLRMGSTERTYVLWFSRDGSFTSEPVPPGEYELRLRLTSPYSRTPYSLPPEEELLGALVQTVVVPPGTTAFDLGTLKVPLKPSPVAKR